MVKRFLALALLAAFCSLSDVAVAAERVQGGNSTKAALTADTQIDANSGDLVGIFVAQSTSCTIKLWNNTAASGAVLVDTFAVSAGVWYPIPFRYSVGLYLDLTGTCSVSVGYYE